MRPTLRDLRRPDLRTLGDVARFISNEAGVPVEVVARAKAEQLERRGVRWSPDTSLEDVRRQVAAALDSPPRRTAAPAGRRRTTRTADPAAERVARLFNKDAR